MDTEYTDRLHGEVGKQNLTPGQPLPRVFLAPSGVFDDEYDVIRNLITLNRRLCVAEKLWTSSSINGLSAPRNRREESL
ncbi:hypothetical protein EYF80_033120 [Liparis tanakae]|uniref:Uncharacterized protein n=1 Tax=Liparis tanakae TaxID=230148 RepID=A0A4Z2GVC1_9TELE|nr:hypothetical protein EYF80_033120 [Liparis tanakae]